MKWSTTKSVVVGKRENQHHPFRRSGDNLRKVPIAEYLEVSLEAEQFGTKLSNERVTKAGSRLQSIQRSFRRNRLSIYSKLLIAKTFIMPIYEYGLQVQRSEDVTIQRMEKLVDRIARWCTGASTMKLVKRARASLGLELVSIRQLRAAVALESRMLSRKQVTQSEEEKQEFSQLITELEALHPTLLDEDKASNEYEEWPRRKETVAIRRQVLPGVGQMANWIRMLTKTHSRYCWFWLCVSFPDRRISFDIWYGKERYDRCVSTMGSIMRKTRWSKEDEQVLCQVLEDLSEHWITLLREIRNR